jgi:hypothetical protein
MVWSEQIGQSIVLPADVDPTAPDRNYVVIGEDVPPEVADQITAGLVFRTNYPTVEAAGNALAVWYWVFGIDTSGAFIIAGYYAVKLQLAGQYLYNRYTLFRLDRDQTTGALTVTIGRDQWGDLVGRPNVSFTGNVDVNGGLTQYGRQAIRTQSGVVNIAIPAVNTTYIQAVTFPEPFDATPAVVATPQTTGPGTATVSIGAQTVNGFNIYITRTIAATINVHWIASTQGQ